MQSGYGIATAARFNNGDEITFLLKGAEMVTVIDRDTGMPCPQMNVVSGIYRDGDDFNMVVDIHAADGGPVHQAVIAWDNLQLIGKKGRISTLAS